MTISVYISLISFYISNNSTFNDGNVDYFLPLLTVKILMGACLWEVNEPLTREIDFSMSAMYVSRTSVMLVVKGKTYQKVNLY